MARNEGIIISGDSVVIGAMASGPGATVVVTSNAAEEDDE